MLIVTNFISTLLAPILTDNSKGYQLYYFMQFFRDGRMRLTEEFSYQLYSHPTVVTPLNHALQKIVRDAQLIARPLPQLPLQLW